MEEGPERERKVRSHCPLSCPEEERQFEKDGRCFSSTSNWLVFFFAVHEFTFCCQAAEIQRVWNLHDVLLSVDYAAEETKGMINLLEEGFVQPSFFQNDNVSGAILTPDPLRFRFWLHAM